MKGLIKNKILLFALLVLALLFIFSEDSRAALFTAPDGTVCDCTDYNQVLSGWSFAGYTDDCTYPMRICTGANKDHPSCNTGDTTPPLCLPPPESCGNGACREGETCSTCSSDCGSCDPQMSTWCESNCYASDSPASQSHIYCGQGWLSWNNMYCYSNPPLGVTCGTCQGGALCGDGVTTSPETCDDGNTETEECAYGQASCTVCGSACTSTSGTTRYCGDGAVDSGNGEFCDDSNVINGDGCTNLCTVETGFTCLGAPSVCERNNEICFDGITNDEDLLIDEGCGGCADYNDNSRIDFDDIFIFADCVGLSSPGGTCNEIRFSKSDWDDDRRVEGNNFDPIATRSDFDNSGRVEIQDMFIFSDNWGASGAAITNRKTDINKDNRVDYDDFFIFSEDLGAVTVPGEDQRCIMQQWTNQADNPGASFSCAQQQQCVTKTTFIGGTVTAANRCLNSFYCNTDPSRGVIAFCSFGETGKTDPATFEVLPEGSEGVCCPIDRFWNGNICEPKTADPCSCGYKISQAEFWNPANGCLNPNTKIACLETKLFSREPQKLTLDILKR